MRCVGVKALAGSWQYRKSHPAVILSRPKGSEESRLGKVETLRRFAARGDKSEFCATAVLALERTA